MRARSLGKLELHSEVNQGKDWNRQQTTKFSHQFNASRMPLLGSLKDTEQMAFHLLCLHSEPS